MFGRSDSPPTLACYPTALEQSGLLISACHPSSVLGCGSGSIVPMLGARAQVAVISGRGSVPLLLIGRQVELQPLPGETEMWICLSAGVAKYWSKLYLGSALVHTNNRFHARSVFCRTVNRASEHVKRGQNILAGAPFGCTSRHPFRAPSFDFSLSSFWLAHHPSTTVRPPLPLSSWSTLRRPIIRWARPNGPDLIRLLALSAGSRAHLPSSSVSAIPKRVRTSAAYKRGHVAVRRGPLHVQRSGGGRGIPRSPASGLHPRHAGASEPQRDCTDRP